MQDELHLVFQHVVVKVVEEVLTLAKMIRRHFFQAIHAAGIAFTARLVEGVEQVQAIEVHQHRSGFAGGLGVVLFQGPGWAIQGVEDRQGVIEGHALVQQQHQRFPETLGADMRDGAAQASVHADFAKQAHMTGSRHPKIGPGFGFCRRPSRGVRQ